MANNSHFAKFPQISLPRSRMKINFTHKLSMMHGYLTPIDCFPVVPGDTWDLKKIASLVHMSTPIVPFMDNIDMYVRIFYCPIRLLWQGTTAGENSFEKFMGANRGAGYQTTIPIFPASGIGNLPSSVVKNAATMRLKLSHLLGKPIQDWNNNSTLRKLPANISVLKERMYYEIWNKYFRAEQVQGEYPIDYGDGVVDSSGALNARVLLTDNYLTSSPGSYNVWNHDLVLVNKKHDYFTSCTLSPQYGPSTTLPLGDNAPVGFIVPTGESWSLNDQLTGPSLTGVSTPDGYNLFATNAATSGKFLQPGFKETLSGTTESANLRPLIADLSNATAASINSLRFAFAVQRYLERSNYGSNHFYEILAVHYSVVSPDARLQRPEYLGGYHYRINVDQVLNATGKTDTTATELGKKGAVSVTADRHFGFTKGFVEPGYVMILAYTKQDRSYSEMVLKEDIKTNKFEFYSPEFANIGDQEVLRFELCAGINTDDVLGYQEAWAEYRFRPSRVSADLNPSITGAQDYWTLADYYGGLAPQLGPFFLEEDRDAVARALATGIAGPDFLCDWFYEAVATRLMPVYSIPGLIDHVGAM